MSVTMYDVVTEQEKKQRSNIRRRCRDRVKRGAALLDRERPGWEKKMDISKFDIWHSDRCILGQVFMNGSSMPGYRKGLEELSLLDGPENEDREERAARYGFTISPDEDGETVEAGLWTNALWEWLAMYWIREIEIRRHGR